MSDNRNVTDEIRPTDALGVLMWEALMYHAYRDWVPAWSWEMYQKQGERIGWMLRQAGITDDMVDLSQMWNRNDDEGGAR